MKKPKVSAPALDPATAIATEPGGNFDRPTRLILLAIMAASMAFSLVYCGSSPVDPDELEHLHAAWMWQQGIQPYTGFFEPHPPLFFLILRPLLATVGDRDLIGLVHHARVLAWFISALTLAGAWRLFRAAFGRRAAWCGGALLACYLAITPHALHVRPDMFSLMLLTFGTALAIEGYGWGCPPCPGRPAGQTPSRWRSLVGGVLMAAAVCALPKAVFWAFAVGGALAIGPVVRAVRGDRRLLPMLAMLAGGVAIPIVLQLAWILLANNMAAFWECNVAANSQKAGILLAYPRVLGEVTRMIFSWPMLSAPLAVIGLAGCLSSGGWSGTGRKSIVLLMALSCVPLILLGGPFAQYQLPLHVVLAGLAGAGLALATRALSVRVTQYAMIGLAAMSLLWVVMLLAVPATAYTPGVLTDLQTVLDRSTKEDTYVGIQHWNPVFIKDADPRLFATYAVFHDPSTYYRLLEAVRRHKPRFVIGFGVPIFEKGQIIPVQLLQPADEVYLRSYAPMIGRSPFVLERQN